jgi:hypothetical protein
MHDVDTGYGCMMLGQLQEAEKWLLTCQEECVRGKFHNSRAYLLLALGELMLMHARARGGEEGLGRSREAKEGLEGMERHDDQLIRKAEGLFEEVRSRCHDASRQGRIWSVCSRLM